jgi:hypothetical protein
MLIFLLGAAVAAFAGVAFIQIYQENSKPTGDRASAVGGLVVGVVMLVVAALLILKAFAA